MSWHPDSQKESGLSGDVSLAGFEPSTVWFPDGTIIIVAESQAFKVYAGVLAHQSSIFADMLQMPQPETQQTYEGCPVVVLQDPAEHVISLMLALYDAEYVLSLPSCC